MVVRQVQSLPAVGVDATVWSIDGRPSTYARTAIRVLALNFERRKYDLVHAHSGHSGLLACLQFRYPLVVSYVGYDLDPAVGYQEGWRRKLERFAFRQISTLIARSIVKSERGFDRLPRRSQARATVLPNGVDRTRLRPWPRRPARPRLGWGEEPVVLFAADPARPVKQFELAVAAVEYARSGIPNVRLVVCNDALPNEIPLWLNAADVLILTSATEGSPNVVKEAMACNLPIVSVDVGDVAEIVAGTRHCCVCGRDPRQLGTALVDVLRSLSERSDGRERSSDLDLPVIARRLLTIYEDALAQRAGPFGFVTRGRSLKARDAVIS
jgi:glycosyltransferase involved in cell wall biosynthesis